jgi:hypothetical protein
VTKKKGVINVRHLNGLQEMIVGFALVLEGEATVRNVVQVLQPLEVGDGHTARVDVHVRNDLPSLSENFILAVTHEEAM